GQGRLQKRPVAAGVVLENGQVRLAPEVLCDTHTPRLGERAGATQMRSVVGRRLRGPVKSMRVIGGSDEPVQDLAATQVDPQYRDAIGVPAGQLNRESSPRDVRVDHR